MAAFQSLDIDDAFDEFMRKCYPEVEAHSAQYRESRRIFFSGGLTVFRFVSEDLTTIPDDHGVSELEKLSKQFEEFFKKRLFQDKD